ncbi:MAG: phosphoribosylglycinamide formyltransferase [Fimbriimonadaceae bacterium]
MSRARVAVIVGTKGRGSNMLSLINAGRCGRMPADVVLVYGSDPGSPALAAAREAKVEVASFSDRADDFEARLLAILRSRRVDLICLAGYLRLLPSPILAAYPNRVLNIHPALLPKFGGKGMYGHHVHEAVLAAGETESGCTVHSVNEVYDEGAVIHQLRCNVLPQDTPETLAARILELEHVAYPAAVGMVLSRCADER